MIDLRTLGTIDLRDRVDDKQLRSVLSQSKRVALLAYVATADSNAYVRRDALLGLFWAEQTQDHARHALSQALHVLRRGLGSDVIEINGDEQVRVNRSVLWCDAAAFEDCLTDGDLEAALELYQGEFLDGLHLSGCPEFERWVDEKRRQLREGAAAAAGKLADERESEGRAVEAVRWARRAAELLPYGEEAHRRLVILLAGVGDRPSAVQAYQSFAERLKSELELDPSDSFHEVVEKIAENHGPLPEISVPQVEVLPRSAQDSETAVTLNTPPPRRLAVRFGVAVVAIASALAFVGLIGPFANGGARKDTQFGTKALPLVVVSPFINGTGDPALKPLGTMASDWITWGLQETGLVSVTTSLPVGASGDFLVRGSVYTHRDSLVFSVTIIEPATDRVLAVPDPVMASREDPTGSLELLRQRLMGELASLIDERMRRWAGLASRPPSYEAYRHFARGLELHLAEGESERALEEYLAAARIDSTFTLPLLWAVWINFEPAREDSLLTVLEARRASMPSFEHHFLDYHQAGHRWDLEAQYHAMGRMVALAPESGFLYNLARKANETNRHREAVSLLERTDPDRGWLRGWPLYWFYMSQSHHALGDHEASLNAAREGASRLGRLGRRRAYYRWLYVKLEATALAALGRAEELDDLMDNRASFAPGSKAGLLSFVAAELESHGFPDDAERYWRETLEEYRRSGIESIPAGNDDEIAVALSYLGFRDEALAVVPRDPRPRDELLWRGIVGLVAADARREEEAVAVWEELEQSTSCEHAESRCGVALLWQAAISASLGERQDALTRLDRALGAGLGNPAQYHSFPPLRSLWGDPDFKALIRPRG